MFEKLLMRWHLVLLEPFGVLALALVAFVALALVRRSLMHRHSAPTTSARVPRSLRFTAGLVAISWITTDLVRVLLFPPPTSPWWQFALPLLVCAVGSASLLIPRSDSRPATGASPLRRTWRSFSPAWLISLCLVLLSALFAVTTWAGILAGSGATGSTYLEFRNGGGVTNFYGWGYGAAVLAASTLLSVIVFLVLRKISSRRFADPSSIALDTAQRRTSSSTLILLSCAALALTLGSAVQSIGNSGTGESGMSLPGSSVLVWGSGYESLAFLLIWSGWALQLCALLALFAVTAGWQLHPRGVRVLSTPHRLEQACA